MNVLFISTLLSNYSFTRIGEAWSVWKWLGITTDVKAERRADRRFFTEEIKRFINIMFETHLIN